MSRIARFLVVILAISVLRLVYGIIMWAIFKLAGRRDVELKDILKKV